MPPELIQVIGAASSISGMMNKGQAQGAAAAGESGLMDTMRQLLNYYMAQGQEFDPETVRLAHDAISALTGQGWQQEQGKAYEGIQQNVVQTLKNLMAQGGPDMAAQMPQLARALGEQAVMSGAGTARDFALSAPDRISQALKIATGMSGRSLLPGALSSMGDMAKMYGSAAGGDPYSGIADQISTLVKAFRPAATTSSIPDLSQALPIMPWETRETQNRGGWNWTGTNPD